MNLLTYLLTPSSHYVDVCLMQPISTGFVCSLSVDLASMMIQCSDLSSSAKTARGFAKKSTVNQVQRAKMPAVTYTESRSARQWSSDQWESLTELFTLPGLYVCTQWSIKIYHKSHVSWFWASDWESTAADCWWLDRWYQKTIGACRTKRPSASKTARHSASKTVYWHQQSQIWWCTSMKNSECQQGDLILFNSFRNVQPVKSGQLISDVIGRSQLKDHVCGSVQYRL